MCEEMKTLVSRLAEYLRRSEQQLRCFHTYESQVEGWFKGELFCFLDQEKRTGRLHDFGREKSGDNENRKRTDIVLQFDKSSPISWVELKHWIGYQNNTPYDSSSYFRVDNNSCIKRDVKKLLTRPKDDDKFMLVPFTPNPGPEDWRAGVNLFNTNFPPLSVRSLTNPDDYPKYFFLGLLHVSD
jgi:hypothetical protein